MHPVIGVVIPAAVLVAVVVLLFMVKPEISSKILFGSIVVCAVLGLCFYGVGYARIETSPVTALIKTVFSLCRIFIGENDYMDVAAAAGYDRNWVVASMYLVHTVGLFSSVGAAISALGANWLKRMRLFFSRGGRLCIIVGTHENALTFARNYAADYPETKLVFADGNPPAQASETVDSLGGVLCSDRNADALNERFLSSIRANTRQHITVCALSENLAQNMRQARQICDALEKLHIAPEKTDLCAIGTDDDTDHPLLAAEDRYGFGSVMMRSRADLAARMLTLLYPPCDHIAFDETGKACEDFHAVIIGFGQVGQAVLKALVMNGQFCGSRFRAAVFAADYEKTMGQLQYECPRVFETYDIEMVPADARSLQMYGYLAQNAKNIRYIAVCTEDADNDEQIAGELEHFLARQGSHAQVYLCSKNGISHHENREQTSVHPVFVPQLLASDRIDRPAMVLNDTYCNNNKTAEENWKNCDYFSRMSSRASADFAPAFLRAAGLTREAVLNGALPQGEVLENLSVTEHERWCAFHYCMGFSPMTDAQFKERSDRYLAQKAAGEKPLRIAKDLDARIHACLIDWEALDGLSKKENDVTGDNVDYKQLDRDNVCTLAHVLAAQE